MNPSIRILSVLFALVITFQPVLPYIEYFTFKKYITENLCVNRNKPECCCQGKCFLKKMLKENNSSQEQKTPLKTHQKAFDSSLPVFNSNSNELGDITLLYTSYLEIYRFIYSNEYFHPPQNYIS
jgi:hypothetical protein